MKKKFILFDFDGVIVDTFEIGFQCGKSSGGHRSDRDKYREMFSGNINEVIAESKKITPEENKDEENKFFDCYIPKLLETSPIDGIGHVIKELAKEYELVVISSTISSPIQEYLTMHGLDSFFLEIMGNDVDYKKTVKIQMVFDKYEIEPKDCVFITDTLGDVREAAKKEVSAIGVDFGFQTREMLCEDGEIPVASTTEELLTFVRDHFNR